MKNRGNEPNLKVKAELTKWIGHSRIVDRRVVDKFGTELVILQNDGEYYTLLRGFTIGDGAGVSVDVNDRPMGEVLTYFLDHYEL